MVEEEPRKLDQPTDPSLRKFLGLLAAGALGGTAVSYAPKAIDGFFGLFTRPGKAFSNPPTNGVISPFWLNVAPSASRPSGIPQSGIWMGTDNEPKMYDGTYDIRIRHPVFNVKSYGAKGDGTTDDTAAINAAASAAQAAGGGTVYFPAGVYIVSSTLAFSDRVALLGDGNASVIKQKNSANLGIIVQFFQKSDVLIQNLQIDGNKANQSSGLGRGIDITIASGSRVKVVGCHVINTFGIGVVIEAGALVTAQVIVEGNWIEGSGLSNMFLTNIAQFVVVGNFFVSPGQQSVTISACQFGVVSSNYFVGSGVGFRCLEVENGSFSVAVFGNGINGSDTDAIVFDDATECSCVGNNIRNTTNGGPAIALFNGASRCTVESNTIDSVTGTGGDGIRLDAGSGSPAVGGVHDCVIMGNVVIGAARDGIRLDADSLAATIDGNIIARNRCVGNTGYGIREAGTVSNVLNNIIEANGCDGNTTGSVSILTGNGDKVRYNRGFNPQGVATITVTASPFTYTNSDCVPEIVYINGGTVTIVTKDGNQVFNTTNVSVWLEPNEVIVVTYNPAPTMYKDRK